MDNSIMLPQAASRPLRRLLLWTAWTFTTLILIVVLGFLYVTFVGISINASFLRGTIAQTFSDNIGRPVRFEGPMAIEISAKPKLRIGGLHIAKAPGLRKQDFASLLAAQLTGDPRPLLFKKYIPTSTP